MTRGMEPLYLPRGAAFQYRSMSQTTSDHSTSSANEYCVPLSANVSSCLLHYVTRSQQDPSCIREAQEGLRVKLGANAPEGLLLDRLLGSLIWQLWNDNQTVIAWLCCHHSTPGGSHWFGRPASRFVSGTSCGKGQCNVHSGRLFTSFKSRIRVFLVESLRGCAMVLYNVYYPALADGDELQPKTWNVIVLDSVSIFMKPLD